MRSGLCFCSGCFHFKFQISFFQHLLGLFVLVFFCFCYLLILLYALCVLLRRVLWNNIGTFGFYWFALSSAFLGPAQRRVILWLWMFCWGLYQDTSYQVLILVLCNERGNGKQFIWASLCQRHIPLTRGSRSFNFFKPSVYCGQQRGEGWLCHHKVNIYRSHERFHRWNQFKALNQVADTIDLWETTINETKHLDFIISWEDQRRRKRPTRRDVCFFTDTCLFGFHQILSHSSLEQKTRYIL